MHIYVVFLTALLSLLCQMHVVGIHSEVVSGAEPTKASFTLDNVGRRCCGDLGCFGITGEFFDPIHRPLNVFPFCPISVGLPGLHLNTRANPNATQIISYVDTRTIARSRFSAKKQTKILIHGFFDNIRFPWWTNMVNELLEQGDYNVIRVDWAIANAPPYTQAVANIRLVGAHVGKFVEHVVTVYGGKAGDFHIIGHSLGAHGGGYVGSFLKEKKLILGRITGLDPAGPDYTEMPTSVRLDLFDAKFVDTVITDGASILALAYGSQQAMGHINFYPNGGINQPGCTNVSLIHEPTTNVTGFGPFETISYAVLENVACNHARSISLFSESINKPPCHNSYECDSYENVFKNEFRNGVCFSRNNTRCTTFGYHTDFSRVLGSETKTYYLFTEDRSPYCTQPYKLTFSLQTKSKDDSAIPERGIIFLTLEGSFGKRSQVQVSPRITDFEPGGTNSFVFPTPPSLGAIKKIIFRWISGTDTTMPRKQRRYLKLSGGLFLTNTNNQTTIFYPPTDLPLPDSEDILMTSLSVPVG